MGQKISEAAWRYSSNAKSILGVKRRRAWLVLGWVTTWGVARSRLTSGLEPVRLITVGLPAGVGVRARAQSFICDRSSVASLHHSTNANSYSESIDFEREIVLGWVNILGVEVSVKLHYTGTEVGSESRDSEWCEGKGTSRHICEAEHFP